MRIKFKIFLYFILALPISFHIAYADMTGKEIMEKQKDRHELKFEQTSIDMILKNKKGRIKERSIIISVFMDDTGLSKVMIKFLSPADIKGVGLLTWEHGTEKEDDQWLYLPAAKKVKRITSSGKKNKFMGTDLAYEDLRPENLDIHSYELKESQTIGGKDCYVIEATPSTEKEKKTSGYSRRVLYIRKDIVFTVKTEYFDKKGKKSKVATLLELENIKDDIWRAKKTIIEDLKTKHSTTNTTTWRDITTPLENSFFTRNNLKKKLH